VDREQRPAPTGNLTCPFRARVATQRLALDNHLDGRTGPVACDQPPVPSRDRVQRHTHRHQQPAGTLHEESTPSSDPDRPHPRPSGSGLRGSPSHDGRGWLSGAAAQAFGGSSTAFSQTGAGIRRGQSGGSWTAARSAHHAARSWTSPWWQDTSDERRLSRCPTSSKEPDGSSPTSSNVTRSSWCEPAAGDRPDRPDRPGAGYLRLHARQLGPARPHRPWRAGRPDQRRAG